MRWLLAMIKHETNTLAGPHPTGAILPRQRRARLRRRGGGAVRRHQQRPGYLDVARETGADVTIPVAAAAWPSGPATAQTYRQLCQPVLDELARGGYDAVLLDLHGAMVTSDLEDAEGDLLRRIREIAPDIPVAVTLDMHANLYDDMVRHATVISGYHTYPHVDIHAAAVRRAHRARALKGEIRPVMAWGTGPCCRTCCARAPMPSQPIAAGALHRTGEPGPGAGRVGVRGLSARRHPRGRPERRGRTDASPRRPSSCATSCWTAPGRRAPTGSTTPKHCNPRSPAPPASNRAPSCCWTIATTRPRAARWTTPRYWPRSCARTGQRGLLRHL